MKTFIVQIEERDMSILHGKGTEYYEEGSDTSLIAEIIANYPIKEVGSILSENIKVLELSAALILTMLKILNIDIKINTKSA